MAPPSDAPPSRPTSPTFYTSKLSSLESEIATLSQHLSLLSHEESDTQSQLTSLTYAADLTYGEVARRERANCELDTAYDGITCIEGGDMQVVQKLEGELLNAKRDSANLTFEVEQLGFRLKRLQEGNGNSTNGNKGMENETGGMCAKSPVIRSGISPKLGSGSLKMSPLGRSTRLIGDVDGVICVDTAEWIGGRVGVCANGSLGIYGYGDSAILVSLDEGRVGKEELNERDLEGLRGGIGSIGLENGDVIVGVWEAVRGVVELVDGSGGGNSGVG